MASQIPNYRQKLMGCWLGKVIGGTLGMFFEGQDGPFDLTYYDPVPQGMVENDDLDLQVVWAVLLSKMKDPQVHRSIFVPAWRDNIQFPWDEYGIAKRNIAQGLLPPQTGSFDNWYVDGMGAAIRSELWASLAPGNPDLAAAFAYEDACLDHDGSGLYAEIFFAAAESEAFICADIHALIKKGLSYVPPSSRLYIAIEDVQSWWAARHDAVAVRELILQKYASDNFTDVVINVAFTILGLLAGNGDFGRTICAAANCGMDTDCTAATAGAIVGIMNPDGIDKKWLRPIGDKIVLSKAIVGIDPPKTVPDFVEMIINLASRVSLKKEDSVSEDISRSRIDIEKAYCLEDIFGGGYPVPEHIPLPKHSAFAPFHVAGTLARVESSVFENKAVLFKYRFSLDDAKQVRIMLNTRENCRVWIDGVYAFGRESGRMAPSFHRVPINQYTDMQLSRGSHEIIATLAAPPKSRKTVEWVIGLGDLATKQWLPNVFNPLARV